MIETEKYELVEKGDVATYKREVETPMPGGSEDNHIWAYRAGCHWLKVSKISNLGWRVWHYREGEDGMERVGSLGSKQNAQEAQRTALHTAEELQ
jgi:hypothetical protein